MELRISGLQIPMEAAVIIGNGRAGAARIL